MRRSTELEICALLWLILATALPIGWAWMFPASIGMIGILRACLVAYRESLAARQP